MHPVSNNVITIVTYIYIRFADPITVIDRWI
jgi:hypothetical protein